MIPNNLQGDNSFHIVHFVFTTTQKHIKIKKKYDMTGKYDFNL